MRTVTLATSSADSTELKRQLDEGLIAIALWPAILKAQYKQGRTWRYASVGGDSNGIWRIWLKD